MVLISEESSLLWEVKREKGRKMKNKGREREKKGEGREGVEKETGKERREE